VHARVAAEEVDAMDLPTDVRHHVAQALNVGIALVNAANYEKVLSLIWGCCAHYPHRPFPVDGVQLHRQVAPCVS
jgi:hypothetical protein